MAKIMLSLREAAAESGLSYYFLRNLCLTDAVFNVRSGNKFLINRNSLLRYIGEDVEKIPESMEATENNQKLYGK